MGQGGRGGSELIRREKRSTADELRLKVKNSKDDDGGNAGLFGRNRHAVLVETRGGSFERERWGKCNPQGPGGRELWKRMSSDELRKARRSRWSREVGACVQVEWGEKVLNEPTGP